MWGARGHSNWADGYSLKRIVLFKIRNSSFQIYGIILYKAFLLKRTVLFWEKNYSVFHIFGKELFFFSMELFFFSMELFFFQCFCMELFFFSMELFFFQCFCTELFFFWIIKIELFFFRIVKIELFFFE